MKKGQNTRGILGMLGVKKKDVTPTAADVAPAEKPKRKPPRSEPPVAFDDAAIEARYQAFSFIREDALKFPECSAKLYDAIIDSLDLFTSYISDLDKVKVLVANRPERIEKIIENTLNRPRAYVNFLGNFEMIHNFLEIKEFKPFKDKVMRHVLSDKSIYVHLFSVVGYFDEGVEYFPEYENAMLEVLANDDYAFHNIVKTEAMYFTEFCNKHPDYLDRFARHVYTSDIVYKTVIFHDSDLDYFIKHFPQYRSQIIEFTISDDERFKEKFCGFAKIYQFGKKHTEYPELLEMLFAKAISSEEYMRGEILCAADLQSIYQSNPAHAEKVIDMILRDPQWVLDIMARRSSNREIFKHDHFKRLQDSFLKHIYLHPKEFNLLVCTELGLNEMIKILPNEEPKLRLYRQLISSKITPLDVIEKHCPDAQSVDEFRLYVEQNIGTMDERDILIMRDTVASLLGNNDEAAQAAMKNLHAYLVTQAEAARKVTAALYAYKPQGPDGIEPHKASPPKNMQ